MIDQKKFHSSYGLGAFYYNEITKHLPIITGVVNVFIKTHQQAYNK